MKWTEIPSGELHAAEQRLRVAWGDKAGEIVKRINTDPGFVNLIATQVSDTMNKIADKSLTTFKLSKVGMSTVYFMPPWGRWVRLKKFILTPIVEKDEKINGSELMKRAEKLGRNAGLAWAKYFKTHQEQIPEECRCFHLVFAARKYKDEEGDLRLVPELDYNFGKEEWSLSFIVLREHYADFDKGTLLVRF